MIAEQFRTRHLLMRPFTAKDGSAVYRYWKSDPGWERYNDSVPNGFTEADAFDFVAEISGNRHQGAIVSVSFAEGHTEASIGYGIHARLRGRGLCVEAVETVLGRLFSTYPELALVLAHTDPENAASIRVLSKLGFSKAPDGSDGGLTFHLHRSEWECRQ